MNRRTKETQSNASINSALQGGGRPKVKSLDHDFSTFSDGQIVPHGIYDVTKNVGYMTLGISHDTSKFVCDNIARVWREHLKE